MLTASGNSSCVRRRNAIPLLIVAASLLCAAASAQEPPASAVCDFDKTARCIQQECREKGVNRTACVSSAMRELAMANPEKFSPPAVCVARTLETSPLAIDSNPPTNNPPHSAIPVRAGLGYIPSCHWPVYNGAVERFENLTSEYKGDVFGGDIPGRVTGIFSNDCTAVCNQGCYHGFGAAFVHLLATRPCPDVAGGDRSSLFCAENLQMLRTICDGVNDVGSPYEIRMFACRRGLGFGVADAFETVDEALQFCAAAELDSTCVDGVFTSYMHSQLSSVSMPALASVGHLIAKCFCYGSNNPIEFATCANAFGQEHFRAFGLKKDTESVCAESAAAEAAGLRSDRWSESELAAAFRRFSRSCTDGLNVEMEARENAVLNEDKLCDDVANETFQCLQFDLGDRPTSAIDLECTKPYAPATSAPATLAPSAKRQQNTSTQVALVAIAGSAILLVVGFCAFLVYNHCRRSRGYETVDGDFELEQSRRQNGGGGGNRNGVHHLDEDDLSLEEDRTAMEGGDGDERSSSPQGGGGLAAAYRSHRENRVLTPEPKKRRNGDSGGGGGYESEQSVASAHDHHALDLEEEVTFDEDGNDLTPSNGGDIEEEAKSDLQRAFARLEAELPEAEP